MRVLPGARLGGDRGQEAAAYAVRRMQRLLREAGGIDLPLRLWDGTELGDPNLGFRVVLRHPWSARAMLRPPFDLAAGEAYAEGVVDLEGDLVVAAAAGFALGERLPAVARARLLPLLRRLPAPPRRPHHRRARLRGRVHSRDRDRAAVAFHYDLPQAFYQCFLDRRMVYSCAYFADSDESLERAQERKLDVICRKLRLRPGMRLLDVGCGWGSLLAHAARHYGVDGVGVTLSRTQLEAGRRRLAEEGLEGRVHLRLQDYRELDERYDAVASVGMFEHVGPQRLSEYFSTVWRLLAPGGLFLNHGIVRRAGRANRKGTTSFISNYVFPDGGLVPLWQAVREAEAAGFEVVDVEQLRPHYALTLRRWVARLEAAHDRAVAAAGEAEFRIWRLYMAGCAYAFETGRMGVAQILASRDAVLPLGRGWMLPADGRDPGPRAGGPARGR